MRFNQQGALLTAVMVAAFFAVLAGAVHRFSPEWRPEPLAVICFLIALEAGFVHYASRQERMSGAELARYLVPELFTMVVVMRLAATLSMTGTQLGPSLQRWLYDPLSIIEPLFVVYVIMGALAGLLAHLSMRDLITLTPRASETPDALGDANRSFAVQLAEDRSAAIKRVGQRFTLGGALLLLALGLEAVNLAQPTGPANTISGLSVVATLVYIVAGFILYSQARLAILRARWQHEGAHVAEGLSRRWGRSAWLLVVGIVGGAALLPRTYGRGLLETLSAGLALVGYAFAVLGYVVVWLFGMLVALPAWLMSLLLPTGGPAMAAPPPPPELPPVPPEVAREPRLLPALIFWLCMLALAVYAARIVALRHPGLLARIVGRGPLGALIGWLRSLWGDASGWASRAAATVAAALHRPPAAASAPRGRVIRLGALAPRELVRYFYGSTLRRAAQSGVERRAGQTPYEYGAALARQVPEAERDIAELTEVFVSAQYSRQAVDDAAARRARAPWERLKRELRSRVTRGGDRPVRQPRRDD